MTVRVQEEPFDMGAELTGFAQGRHDTGAVVTFSGLVRDDTGDLRHLEIEHYPGMTEASLAEIEAEARQRWPLDEVTLIHRIGRLEPGDPIVLVVVASAHRRAAFEACEFLMDHLKTRAPFWKKEHTESGDYWVSERRQDHDDAKRWEVASQ